MSDYMDISKAGLFHFSVCIPLGTECDDLLLKADVSCYGTFSTQVHKSFGFISLRIGNIFNRSLTQEMTIKHAKMVLEVHVHLMIFAIILSWKPC